MDKVAEAREAKLRTLRARLALLRERREKAEASLARSIRRAQDRLDADRLRLTQLQEELARLQTERERALAA